MLPRIYYNNRILFKQSTFKKKYIMAKAKVYSFHESLHTMKELAELFNLSYCRMSNLMHKFNHDADTIYLQRNSEGAKRSGKNPRVFAIDSHGNSRMTVAEIAEATGYSNAAISGKINRGVIGSKLLKKKKIKPLYSAPSREESTDLKKLPTPVLSTARTDKASITTVTTELKGTVNSTVGATDIEDRQQINSAVDEFLAAGGKIKKLQASGSINGQSWKEQAKKTWSKRKRKLEIRKVTAHPVNGKGATVNVDDFIKELESERDQRRAYGEVLHLAGDDPTSGVHQILDTDLEVSLPNSDFGESLEKK